MAQKGIGLSLSGGGLKGFSQVAVLQDLEKHNINIAALAGSSMGSIIAALIGIGYDGQSLEKRALDLEKHFEDQKIFKVRANFRNLITSKGRFDGIVHQSLFEKFCRQFFKEDGITFLSEVKKPLAITAVDIDSGQLYVFTNNRDYFREHPSWAFYPEDIELGKAVAASCAYPMVFSTAMVGGHRMSDGGILLNSPVSLFERKKLSGLMSVTMIGTNLEPVPLDAIKVAIRSLHLTMIEMSKAQNKSADVVINFPFPAEDTFNIGRGKDIINTAKDMLKSNPIDYTRLGPKWRKLIPSFLSKH